MLDKSQWALQPSDPKNTGKAQIWTNPQTGQQFYGHTLGMIPGVVIQVDPKTGNRIKDANLSLHDGQPHKDDSLGDFFKNSAMLIGGALTGGALLAGGGAAAGGTAAAGSAAGGTAAGTTAAATAAAGAAPSFISRAMNVAGKVAPALTAMNSGAAAGRVAEGNANQGQNDAILRSIQMQLQRASASNTAQHQDYADMVHGSLLQGLRDTTITPPAHLASHVGTIEGGARPSAIGNADAIGSTMEARATKDLVGKGDPNTGLTALRGINVPTPPPLPSTNGAQNALGYLAPGLSLVDTIANAIKRKPQPATAGATV